MLVWLTFILPAVITGEPLSNIGVGTTIPTFTLDLGIILPTTYYCGYSLLKKRRIGYQLAPVLFVAIICVGIAVISQTIMQLLEGIHIEPGQFVGLVGTFVVLGVFAIVLNYRMLRWVRE